MNQKILTLCVAAYNVEQSIEDMIQSVISSGDTENIELLIVNDGSTDKTGDIILQYCKKYPNLITYVKKENGGSGSARNVGIQKASGIYFKLLDGDDKVDSEGLHKLVQCLIQQPADLVMTKRLTLNGNKVVQATQWNNIPVGRVISINDLPSDFDFQMHFMAVRTAILQDNHITLTEKISYVDTEYIAYIVPHVSSVLIEDYVVYIYYIGLATQSMNPYIRFKKKHHMEIITLNIARYYQPFFAQESLPKKKRRMLEKILLRRVQNTMELYLKDKDSVKSDYIRFDKELSAVSDYISQLLSKYIYMRILRLGRYRMYSLFHVYRVIKYKVYLLIYKNH